jgi:hypothetical protein
MLSDKLSVTIDRSQLLKELDANIARLGISDTQSHIVKSLNP